MDTEQHLDGAVLPSASKVGRRKRFLGPVGNPHGRSISVRLNGDAERGLELFLAAGFSVQGAIVGLLSEVVKINNGQIEVVLPEKDSGSNKKQGGK